MNNHTSTISHKLNKLNRLIIPHPPEHKHPTPKTKAFLSYHTNQQPDINTWLNGILTQVDVLIHYLQNNNTITDPYQAKQLVDITAVRHFTETNEPFPKQLRRTLTTTINDLQKGDTLLLPSWSTIFPYTNQVTNAANQQKFHLQLLQ